MFLVPTMINLLVARPDRHRYDLSSLHTIFYGGAPMYVEHLLEAVGPPVPQARPVLFRWREAAC